MLIIWQQYLLPDGLDCLATNTYDNWCGNIAMVIQCKQWFYPLGIDGILLWLKWSCLEQVHGVVTPCTCSCLEVTYNMICFFLFVEDRPFSDHYRTWSLAEFNCWRAGATKVPEPGTVEAKGLLYLWKVVLYNN